MHTKCVSEASFCHFAAEADVPDIRTFFFCMHFLRGFVYPNAVRCRARSLFLCWILTLPGVFVNFPQVCMHFYVGLCMLYTTICCFVRVSRSPGGPENVQVLCIAYKYQLVWDVSGASLDRL